MRTRYIPDGATEIKADDVNAIAYLYEKNGRLIALAYSGNRSKADFHYAYHDEHDRQERIRMWLDGLREHKARVAARRADLNSGHDLKVGDILSASWGYDQTNVDFYKVVELRGKTMVRILPVSQAVVGGGRGSDSVVAQPDSVRDFDVLIGVDSSDEDKSVWKRATKYGVSLEHCHASKWHGEAMHQTAYGYGH